MRIGQICIRDVACADKSTSVKDAALLMRSHHVGNVVVIENGRNGRIPVGLVTDRDVTVGVVALGIDPSQFTVEDIMATQLITADEDQGVFETAEQMQRGGVRRLPVVDKGGALVGIVTLDDLLEFLTMHLSALSRAVARERRNEIEVRR